jgi:hypothetical protein
MKTIILICGLCTLMGAMTVLGANPQNHFGAPEQAIGGSGNRFQTAQLVSSGGPLNAGANVVAVGDFNGDGKPDLATPTQNGLNILLSDGTGKFTLASTLAIPPADGTLSLAVGDFNGDTKADVAVVTTLRSAGTVSIFLGNGNGTFTTGQVFAIGATFSRQPQGLAVGDINGDGKLDLVAVNGGSNTISVALGNGNGTFQTPQSIPVPTRPTAVAVADINGDGKLDLVVADGFISVLLGNGNGTFQPATTVTTNGQTVAVAIADFNGDGKLDLAAADYSDNGVSEILLGNGDGTFQSASQVFCGIGALSIATADFNGDGKTDLVLADLGNDDVCVLTGKGDGTFQAEIYGVDTAPSGIAVADFNGDGKTDWVAASEADPLLSLAFGNGNGTFQAAPQYTVGSFAAALGDFNKDGKLDLAIAAPNGLYIFLGNGDGTFQASTQLNTFGEVAVAVGDFNNDGNLDMVAPQGFFQDQGLMFLGNGDGTFQPGVGFQLGSSSPAQFLTGDFNNDGKLDLAVSTTSNNAVNILLGNGDGTLQPARTFVFGSSTGYMAAGDFNKDGKLDIAVADSLANGVNILLGDGQGGLGTPMLVPAGRLATGVATGDFNHDGKLDLAVTNQADNNVTVLLGKGDGSFTFSANYSILPPGSGGQVTPLYVAAADFNGDGKLDLVVANGNNRANGSVNIGMQLLVGNGDGTFQTTQGYLVGAGSNNLAVGDLNKDGALDVVVTNPSGGILTVLMNTGGTFVKLTSSANPSGIGQAVTFTARVTTSINGSGSPTGTVTFKDGTKVLGTVALTSDKATFTTSTLSAGTHSINATYSGDSTFNRHSSGALSQVVSGVTLSPTKLSFGNVKVGKTGGPKNVTVTNSGSTAVTITSIAIGGANAGDFAQTNNCPISPNTLGPGASCSASVTFTPTSTGKRTGTLQVNDNAGGSPQQASLTGTGT